MRLKEALVLFLLVTVSNVFGDGPPATDAPTTASTPAPNPDPVVCVTREPTTTTNPPPAKPTIADTFEMIAEVTNATATPTETAIIKEYYDKSTNRSAKYMTKNNEETRELNDYTNMWRFTATMKDSKCDEGTKIDQGIPDMFQFVDGGLQDFFDTSARHSFAFINKTQIRGLNCELWSTCMRKDEKDVIIDWYFAAADAKTPRDHEKSVPVRLDVFQYNKDKSLQAGELNYHLTYNFIDYNEEITDASVFWPELGFLCGNTEYYTQKKIDKTPNIADSFSVDLEQIHTSDGKTWVTSGKYAMDKENSLMRMDIEISKHEESNYKAKCGDDTGICKIIHDYTSGAEYVFDTKGKCKIYALKTTDGKPPMDAVWDDDHKDKDNKTAYLLLATGMHLFGMDDVTAWYQGERKFRGVTTEAWAFKNQPKGIETYREFLFQKSDSEDEVGKLFGYLENGKAGEKPYQLRTNFYNYNAETPDQSAFDVHDCFVNDTNFKTLHARVDLKENWNKVNKTGIPTLQPLIRKTLAKLAGIAVLRITDMQIATDDGDHDNDGKVQVWFTILSPTPTGGAIYTSDGSIKPDKKVEDAEKSLEDSLDKSDQPVQRNETKDGKTTPVTLVTIKKDSLKADDDALKGDPRSSQQSNQSSGHSSTQMGVLAFFMLVLGAVLGVGIGWWMWKRRNRGVPYQIHH